MTAERPTGELDAVRRPEGDIVVALAGNPNVGKSTIFNALTGLGVQTAHYPGTTREVHTGTARVGERVIGVVDLPGTYGLRGSSDDARVARLALGDTSPDVVMVIVDAMTLSRTLVLALEVMDLGLPTMVLVNLADEAKRAGIVVDASVASRLLGVPVVVTAAMRGIGVREAVDEALALAAGRQGPSVRYSPDFEALIAPLIEVCAATGEPAAGARAAALRLLETEAVDVPADPRVRDVLESVSLAVRSHFAEGPAVHVARERHRAAGRIAKAAVTKVTPRRGLVPREGWSLTTWPWTGVPLALAVAAAIFGFLFFVGDALATAFSSAWQAIASPAIESVIHALAGEGVFARVLGWGFDAGIEASLAIGLPYILTFYFLLGLLEDTGYLNSLAFLTDRMMHRLGLHGRAVVSLVAAAGCNVPALIAAGDLPTKRERLIASTLVLFVPCSARTAVIMGAVGHYVGWQPTLLVLGVVFAMWLGVGLVLQRMLPGTSGGLVMEMFGFRRPSLRRVAEKAWAQFREFLFVATPIVIVGSLVLGALYETGWLEKLAGPLDPVVVGWLGLPAVAGLTLVVGMLRKELSLQLLVALAVATAGFAGARLTDIMSPADLVVYALVNAIALPCISSVAVFWRRQGWARTVAVVAASVALALLVGGTVARVLPLVGLE